MKDKQQILAMLREEFNRWEALLSGMSEEQVSAPRLPGDWSIKDVMGHLRAWQQVGIARLEAAVLDREPRFPAAPEGLDLDTENDVAALNAWIYATYRDQPWSSVYRDWRAGFLRFVELGDAIPERDLLEAGRYPWLRGYSLADGLLGSYEHHHEHRDDDHLKLLLARLREGGTIKSAG